MENVLNVLNSMVHEQKIKRQEILRNIDEVEADLEMCYSDLRAGIYTGVELEELKFDINEKQELVDALHGDLSSVNYMIRQLRSKAALVEFQVL